MKTSILILALFFSTQALAVTNTYCTNGACQTYENNQPVSNTYCTNGACQTYNGDPNSSNYGQ